MTEERADYLMEAFLDEQNTLIRPLVNRKLHLIKILDERSNVIEKLVDDKRRKFLATTSPGGRGQKGGDLASAIDQLEDELEQIANEKVTVCLQLMDLVKRPFETILEVESTLKNAAAVMTDGDIRPTQVTAPTTTTTSTTTTVSRSSQHRINPPEEELWCFCRKPDDGRQMVACDNPNCDISWWHIDCLDSYITQNRIGSIPTDDGKWMCPICIAAEIVSREEAAREANVGEKRRRARRI